ncbi:hypothetical protein AVEN_153742-1 [Araneus ventricosus]|uniref:Uncharacterized protein n=1 Tax=Araneus ventricosus TaxID=182803 RepID=A0A4Y2P4I8_ARAVE|nr:hypothetical protein AVEN_153742-1 [Araneus ventricosus]
MGWPVLDPRPLRQIWQPWRQIDDSGKCYPSLDISIRKENTLECTGKLHATSRPVGESMQKEEYEEWMSNDKDIPVAATLTDLEIFPAVCEQDQAIKVDDSDGDECVEENPPTNVK